MQKILLLLFLTFSSLLSSELGNYMFQNMENMTLNDVTRIYGKEQKIDGDGKNSLATPIYYAAANGKIEIVKFLLENHANSNLMTDTSGNALHVASYSGHYDIVKLLLEAGADRTLKNPYDATAMTLAIGQKHKQITELLRYFGIDKSKHRDMAIVYGLDPNGEGYLSIRQKPNGKKIGKLYNSDKVKILDKRGKWYKIQDQLSDAVGWSHSNFIKKSSIQDLFKLSGMCKTKDVYNMIKDVSKNELKVPCKHEYDQYIKNKKNSYYHDKLSLCTEKLGDGNFDVGYTIFKRKDSYNVDIFNAAVNLAKDKFYTDCSELISTLTSNLDKNSNVTFSYDGEYFLAYYRNKKILNKYFPIELMEGSLVERNPSTKKTKTSTPPNTFSSTSNQTPKTPEIKNDVKKNDKNKWHDLFKSKDSTQDQHIEDQKYLAQTNNQVSMKTTKTDKKQWNDLFKRESTNKSVVKTMDSLNDSLSIKLTISKTKLNAELFTAVKYEDKMKVEQLLKAGAYPDTTNEMGVTPIYLVATLKNEEILKSLIHYGADLNKELNVSYKMNHKSFSGHFNSHPINLASKYNDHEVIKLLLKLGANPNQKENKYEKSPLHKLSYNKNPIYESINSLLQYGAKVDASDDRGFTPLADILSGQEDNDDLYKSVKLLLEKGANPNVTSRTKGGYGPIMYASKHNMEIIKLIEQYGGNFNIASNNGETPLHEVECPKVAQYFINTGLRKYINHKDEDNETPLQEQFDSSVNYGIVKIFLKNGANVHVKNYRGDSLLQRISLSSLDDDYAGTYEKSLKTATKVFKLARLLLEEYNIDINNENNEGETILDETLEYIKVSDKLKLATVKFLLKHKATLKKVNAHTIDAYYQAMNTKKISNLNSVLDSSSYEHLRTEMVGECGSDQRCIQKVLGEKYATLKHTILKKKDSDYFVLVSKISNNIIISEIQKLTVNSGKVSFGGK